MSVGRVVAVYTERQGCAVSQTVVGDDTTTVIPVDSFVVNFDELGGSLQHAETGDIYFYASTDDEAETITLSAGLPSGKTLAEDDSLYVWPLANDYWADVAVDDVEGDEPVSARVPQEFRSILAEGNDVTQQIVELAASGEDWKITGLMGFEPVIDGAYIDPVTLPTPPLTDGDPPSVSPPVTITPGILSLIAQWDGIVNNDAVLYDVHLSTSSGFTADASTLLEDGYAGTLKVITSTHDGSELDPDTVYYVRIVAKDADGAADAGTEGSGQPLRIIGTTHITDDSIATPQLQANSVTADKAVVNEIVAQGLAVEQLIAGVLKTAESGRRMEMGNLGLFGFESDESSLLSIPTDGSASILNMDVVAKSLLALNGAILRNVSRITKGGALELESATETPMVAPTVSLSWPRIQVTGSPLDYPAVRRGLFWDASDSTWRYVTTTGSTYAVDADGDLVSSASLPTFGGGEPLVAEGGITKVGSEWFVLGRGGIGSSLDVFRLDAAFNLLDRWDYNDEAEGGRPAIGNDGTNILIARVAPNDSNKLKIRAYNPTTGAPVSSVASTTGVGNVDVRSIAVGTFDFGATRYVSAIGGPLDGGTIKVFNTSGVVQANEEWPTAESFPVAGLAWNGSDWLSLSQSDVGLHTYTDNLWTTESAKWWVAYSLYDGNAVGDGIHETPLSPMQTFTMKKRAALRWTTPSIPDSGGTDDPDRVRIWIHRGPSEDLGGVDTWLNDSPASGVVTDTIESAVFSGTPFSTGKAADFTDNAPAEIRTVDGFPLLRADGRVRLRLTCSSQDILGSSDREVNWTSAPSDIHDMWNPAVHAGRITPPYPGQYFLAYNVLFAADGDGHRKAWMEVSDNGVDFTLMPATQTFDTGVGGVEGGNSNALGMLIPVTTGQVFRLRVWQNSGVAAPGLNISAFLSLIYEGPA